MNERAGQYLSTRRVRDRSAILLLIGLALLISPIAGIFEIDAKLGGIPVTLIYLFSVWAMLIAGTARLARSLSTTADELNETTSETDLSRSTAEPGRPS